MVVPVAPTKTVIDSLPPKLLRFFARYPPETYSAKAIPKPQPPPDAVIAPPASTPYVPSRTKEAREAVRMDRSQFWSPSAALLRSNPEHPNPFLPLKNFRTGRWRGPAFSLRRQAVLTKLAAKHGIEDLLPPGKKSTEYKETKLHEKGLRVRGTGVDQRVKGHKWERDIPQKLEKRKKAMLYMPEMIRMWKQVCNGTLLGCCSPYPSLLDTFRSANALFSVVMVVDGRNTRANEAVTLRSHGN